MIDPRERVAAGQSHYGGFARKSAKLLCRTSRGTAHRIATVFARIVESNLRKSLHCRCSNPGDGKKLDHTMKLHSSQWYGEEFLKMVKRSGPYQDERDQKHAAHQHVALLARTMAVHPKPEKHGC